jgi:hypothetical protein
MSDIKVLYVIGLTEHERGWGCRPEGYLGFLTEAEADAYIKAENAAEVARNPSGVVPDCYWTYNKVGYREAHPSQLKAVKTNGRGRVYVDRVNELLIPAKSS